MALGSKILKKIEHIGLDRIDNFAENIHKYAEALKKNYSLSEEFIDDALKQFPDTSIFYEKSASLEFTNYTLRILKDDEKKQEDLLNIHIWLDSVEWKANKNIEKGRIDQNAINKVEHALKQRAAYLDFISVIIFKQPIHEIVKEALNGDDDKLLQAIYLDKSLINSPKIAKRIQKASLNNEKEFTRKVSQQLEKDLDVNKTTSEFKLFYFLAILWGAHCYTLTDKELCKLITKYDIYAVNPRQLRTFRCRHGFTKKKSELKEIFSLS